MNNINIYDIESEANVIDKINDINSQEENIPITIPTIYTRFKTSIYKIIKKTKII